MAASRNKRELAAEQRKIDNRKTKLMELSGENSVAAFERVRLIHDQGGPDAKGTTWIEAYDIVIAEVEAAAPKEDGL